MKYIIYKNHTIKIICQPGGGKVACESFLFSFKRCPRINPSWKQTGPALMENALLTRQLPSLLWWIPTEAWRKETFLLPTHRILWGEPSLSAFLCTKIHQVCLLLSKMAWKKKKRMFYYLFTLIYFVDSCHCPTLGEEEWRSSAGSIMMLGLIFFFNTAISSISLTVNVSFTTLQAPKFGRQFLLGCVLLSGVSMASFVRIMNF